MNDKDEAFLNAQTHHQPEIEHPIEKEITQSYIDYSMSVIISRALPDTRDWLKPVIRRILFGMYQMNNVYSQKHKKSARIVWEVMWKYHPHGDSAIYDALVKKYHLGNDKKQNRQILQGHGYVIGDEILGKLLHGTFVRTDKIAESDSYYSTRKKVDTHKHGMQLLHSTDAIKSTLGLSTGKVKTILERLFRKGGNSKCKLLSLETAEFYAFVINNEHMLRDEFRQITSSSCIQGPIPQTKKGTFRIPEQDFFKYDPGVKNEIEYLSNAYHEYTSGYATSTIRSLSEQLFEQYCETRDDIDWVYKNGDAGQQYFSIVYLDSLYHQWLFYADYIVKKKDGTVWVIETKGGESKGKDKNIDPQIANKFEAFKTYASKHNLKWGFVRDKDSQLYINNTVFAMDMADDHWEPLGKVFWLSAIPEVVRN